MTKEQLIRIAQVGFPQRVKQFIDFEKLEMFYFSGVYLLYDVDTPFLGFVPKHSHLSIHIDEDNFIQIQVGANAFNHYAAIKEMELLGIIPRKDNKINKI